MNEGIQYLTVLFRFQGSMRHFSVPNKRFEMFSCLSFMYKVRGTSDFENEMSQQEVDLKLTEGSTVSLFFT